MSAEPKAIKVIRVFDPFDHNYARWSKKGRQIQKTAIFSTSRFREIMEHIIKVPTARQKKWMQESLQMELDAVSTCIGNAYAGSQVIEIPLLLRSLCDTLAVASTDSLPLDIDPGMVDLLAAGTSSTALDRRVNSYSHAWWLKNTPPADITDILNGANLLEIMKYHEAELKKFLEKECEDLSKASQSTASVPSDVVPTQIKPILMLLKDADSATCNSCSRLSFLADDLLHQLRGFKTMLMANVGQLSNGVDRIARRAAGFFKLYEASQSLSLKPEPTPDTPSSKWTWDGGDLGERSELESNLRTHSQHPSDDLSSRAERKAPPSDVLDFPKYFKTGTDGSDFSGGEMADFDVGSEHSAKSDNLEDILDAALELMETEDQQAAALESFQELDQTDSNSDSGRSEAINQALDLYADELEDSDSSGSDSNHLADSLANEAADLFFDSADESDHSMDIDQNNEDINEDEDSAQPQFTSKHFSGNLELDLFE
ncbi:hypothetical protein JR316_0002981 [Psilocybe cubensis]|uniref:Uncharacterized protein n=2 Tax=Psilocybe cubensis TaxID=181762 RepID=A0A8H7Y1V8_PSICU|nr:hypothetical protein JR316_0002981 [Psilocybe cubensis]KAH9483513.1 hypothetical protein JR316_0002981 [Psilocybe cubensis]